jgi:ribosomal protein S18 acetylase RimI-like enzyme
VTLQAAPPVFALPAALLSRGFTLRPETEADIPFLMRLFASTREDELATVPWTVEQKQAFLAQQFAAQRHHYRNFIDGCIFDVIEHDGEPAGRFYLQERPSRLHMVEVALLPAWRGQGVGTALLEALQEAGRASGRSVTTFVERFNPAQRLYRRLGFAEIADHGVYLEMEWRPQEHSQPEGASAAAPGGSSGS